MKYKSSLTSAASITALQRQVKLASPKDFWKIVVQACGSDDFPFLRATSGNPPFVFQCALLEHLNVVPSELHPNSWAMVRAFKILCPFFNIWPNVSVFLNFFQMKLTGNIGWVFDNCEI